MSEISAVTSEEKYLNHSQGRIFVKIWNPEKLHIKTPILLLHDSLGCVDIWRDFPEKLAQTLNTPVVAYDRWGFGRSTERDQRPSVNFIDEEALEYFPWLLHELGVAKCGLLGHSVGGAMAVACAAQFPDLCEFVITESSQAFVEQRTLEGIRKAELDFKDPKMIARLEKYHSSKTPWVLDAWIGVWLSPEFASWRLLENLKKVVCPLLALHGDKDEYGSVEFPKTIVKYSSGKTKMKIFENCGHVPHREIESVVLAEVKGFIETLS